MHFAANQHTNKRSFMMAIILLSRQFGERVYNTQSRGLTTQQTFQNRGAEPNYCSQRLLSLRYACCPRLSIIRHTRFTDGFWL